MTNIIPLPCKICNSLKNLVIEFDLDEDFSTVGCDKCDIRVRAQTIEKAQLIWNENNKVEENENLQTS